MHTVEAIRYALDLSASWLGPLASDLADQPLAAPTPRGGNHAMWVMGHAACAEWGLLGMLTGEASPVASWDGLFMGGTQPVGDASVYPSYETVRRAAAEARSATLRYIDGLNPARLSEKPGHVPAEFEGMPEFRTIGRVLLFIALHQMSHFGQLADVRRALGRSPLNDGAREDAR